MRHLLFPFLFVQLIACSSDSSPEPDVVLPTLTVQSLSIDEGSVDKSVFLSLRLDKAAEEVVVLTLRTEDLTAVDGEDYVGFDSKVIEFNIGSTQENLRIEIIGDELFEDDESFLVKVLDIIGAKAGITEIVVEILNDDISKNYNIPSTGYTTSTTYAGMDLIWSDEFDQNKLDENSWTYEIGNGSSGWGNNELQFYRRENTDIFEGHLIIQARDDNIGGFQYTSSRIITKNKFEFTHGRVDIRAVTPEGQGLWPALWMLGENISSVGWPECGEIDIMELLGQEPSTVHGTVHYPDPNGNRLLNGTSTTLSGGKRFSDEFHVFSLIWSEDKIEWYVDDVKYHTVTKGSLGDQNPYPFNDPFFFIFNVAVGGDWPGSPDGTTSFPQNMIVDYIRVFQEK